MRGKSNAADEYSPWEKASVAVSIIRKRQVITNIEASFPLQPAVICTGYARSLSIMET